MAVATDVPVPTGVRVEVATTVLVAVPVAPGVFVLVAEGTAVLVLVGVSGTADVEEGVGGGGCFGVVEGEVAVLGGVVFHTGIDCKEVYSLFEVGGISKGRDEG